MILLLIWFTGTAFLSWVIWSHHWLHQALIAAACLAWPLWVFGVGFGVVHWFQTSEQRAKRKREWAAAAQQSVRAAETARAAQRSQAFGGTEAQR